MPPTYVIPPDDRNVGTGNPPVDVNELSDVEGLLAQVVAQLAGFPGNAVPAGNAANVTSVQAFQASGVSMQQVMVPGLAADGVTDDGPVIQAVLSAINSSGKHSFEVVAEAPPGGVIYINSTVEIQSSGIRLRFGSPVLYGPLGRMRIYGAYASLPTSGFPHLTTNVSAGATAITVTDRSYFAAGSFIEIRGDHDSSGAAEWFEYVSVTSVTAGSGSTGTLNLASALVYSYQVTYTSGSFTEIVAVSSSLATVAPARGDVTVTVASTAAFTANDYVQVLDDSLTTSSSGSPQPGNYYHREIAQVRTVVDSTHLQLSHALHHNYVLLENARVTKINPVIGSEIADVSATWGAISTVEDAFEIKFAVQSAIRNCRAAGNSSTSWLNQAFRQGDSLFCEVSNCYADRPALTSSGQGYGATLYGATYCTIRDSKFSGCRHSVLFYYGAAGNQVFDCKSEDARISDYDLHGAESVDNWIHDCIAVGGDSVPDDDATPIKAACKAGNENHIQGDDYNTFSAIEVVNYAYNGTAGAMQVVPQSIGTTFRDCRIQSAAYGIRLVANSGNTTLVTTDTTVDGCHFEDVTNLSAIDGGTSAILSGVTIRDCEFDQATTALTCNNADEVAIRRNDWIDPDQPATTYAVYCQSVTNLSIRSNDVSGSYRGVKISGSPAARIYGNIMNDLADTTVYEDAGGNTGAYFAGNNAVGFTLFSSYPNPPGVRFSGGGPSAQQIISTINDYLADTPQQHSYTEWNYDPIGIQSSGGAVTAGTIYRAKCTVKNGGPVTTIDYDLGTIGTGTAPANAFFAIYDDTGTRLAITADFSGTLSSGSTGVRSVSLGGTVNLIAGLDYYVEFLIGTQAGTAAITVARAGTVIGVLSANQTNAQSRFATESTGQSALPSSITPATVNSTTQGLSFWFGLR